MDPPPRPSHEHRGRGRSVHRRPGDFVSVHGAPADVRGCRSGCGRARALQLGWRAVATGGVHEHEAVAAGAHAYIGCRGNFGPMGHAIIHRVTYCVRPTFSSRLGCSWLDHAACSGCGRILSLQRPRPEQRVAGLADAVDLDAAAAGSMRGRSMAAAAAGNPCRCAAARCVRSSR